jgi:uncharacterized protein YndB with AHSA1/START domain
MTADSTPPDAPGTRHDTFTITRDLPADPATVFAAFTDDTLRRRWFRLPGSSATYRHRFEVGGGENASSVFTPTGAPAERLAYRSRYLDIVPDRRIVFGYEAVVDERPRWTALVTVRLTPNRAGCTLAWTEQVTFLVLTGDGGDDIAHLRGGTALRLNGLEAVLRPA